MNTVWCKTDEGFLYKNRFFCCKQFSSIEEVNKYCEKNPDEAFLGKSDKLFYVANIFDKGFTKSEMEKDLGIDTEYFTVKINAS